ncbi:hypothetical protein KO507_10530 [Gilvimarinus agarilyticus]|uniref:hypothetical protein n=1 Tax=Gilvimarinus sp. 2_MG-2023 TaxID=3062666 RepID=UPI001C087AEA|nr:hypothetical protein [Gilvimarinus sp. 2_MG-2023]MBU2886198.1 hypothetical protein [Gilvimarinus agarilyticus]MDO6570887.1 hypothetical protein [Gilvimarinus sp. 2_MG-2023]
MYHWLKRTLFASAILSFSCLSSAAIQVNINPTTTLFTNEGGSAVTYQVVLDEAPSAGEVVTVATSGVDASEGSVSADLTFTDADWDTPQFITVTPVDDGVADGNVAYTITNTTSAVGGTASFDAAPTPNVNVTNFDDEIANIFMNPSSGGAFILNEGSSQTVTMSVSGAPANDISVDVSIAGGEATVSVATVVLTAGNGFSATFDVAAVADMVVDADQAFTVVTAPAVSADGSYSGININDIDGIAVNVDAASGPSGSPTPLPTTSALGQLVLFLMLAAMGGYAVRRKR